MGRFSKTIKLEELPLEDCHEFWPSERGAQVLSAEKCKILAITGGVPRYLEEVNAKKTAEENIWLSRILGRTITIFQRSTR